LVLVLVSHPLHAEALVQQPRVQVRQERRAREAKDVDAVVDADKNDVVFIGKPGAVVDG
jgi:ketosteroid isomerase-like protein